MLSDSVSVSRICVCMCVQMCVHMYVCVYVHALAQWLLGAWSMVLATATPREPDVQHREQKLGPLYNGLSTISPAQALRLLSVTAHLSFGRGGAGWGHLHSLLC